MLHGIDDHAAGRERSAGDPRGEILVVVVNEPARLAGRRRPPDRTESSRHSQTHFLAEHLDGARTERQVNRAARPAEHLQQPHGIRRAAGAGHRDDQVGRAVAAASKRFIAIASFVIGAVGRERLGPDIERGDSAGQADTASARSIRARPAGRAWPGRRETRGRSGAGSRRRRPALGASAWPIRGSTWRKNAR